MSVHPAAETFVYAGVLPAVVCAAVVGGGCALAGRFLDKSGWIAASGAGALGLFAALAAANWRQGLVEWRPGDSLDWLLWTPPLLGLASAGVYAVAGRRLTAAGIGLAFILVAAWLVTPQRESHGADRWLWLGATAAGTAWLWLAGGLSLNRRPWTGPLLLAVACCGEAVLLATSWSLRLADLATVGAGVMGSALVMLLLLRSERAQPFVRAAVFSLVVGVSVLLAAVAIYGAMENFSDTPDVAFYLPLVVPGAAFLIPPRPVSEGAGA